MSLFGVSFIRGFTVVKLVLIGEVEVYLQTLPFFQLPSFFSGHHTYSMYAPNLIFTNNLLRFSWTLYSRWSYQCFLGTSRALLRMRYTQLKLDLLRITKSVESGKIKARWRLRGKPRLWFRERYVLCPSKWTLLLICTVILFLFYGGGNPIISLIEEEMVHTIGRLSFSQRLLLLLCPFAGSFSTATLSLWRALKASCPITRWTA